MTQPYNRVAVMHLTIIFCGFTVNLFRAGLPELLMLTILKIALDAAAHLGEHSERAREGIRGKRRRSPQTRKESDKKEG
jgi:hypothetical protein